MDLSKHHLTYGQMFEKEKEKEKEHKKKFKFVKRYKNFDLYEHKKFGYKECFKK